MWKWAIATAPSGEKLVDDLQGTPEWLPAVWSKAYSEDEDCFIKKRAENSSFGFSDGKRLSTEIRRGTQFAPDSIRPY